MEEHIPLSKTFSETVMEYQASGKPIYYVLVPAVEEFGNAIIIFDKDDESTKDYLSALAQRWYIPLTEGLEEFASPSPEGLRPGIKFLSAEEAIKEAETWSSRAEEEDRKYEESRFRFTYD